MVEFFRQIVRQFQSVFHRLSARQKIVVTLVSFGTFGIILYIMMWAGQREFVVLFSNLDPEDAQMIRQKLEEQHIDYKLETDGTAITVPQGVETGLRLQFAAEGLTTQRGVGYEIFDRPNLGLTDFVQRLNFRRGLEGELARTIRNIDGVERVRVHIVLPEAALFEEDRKETTASVVVTLRSGVEMGREQVQSIARLVSYSVEGLEPRNVSVVDSFGNNLSQQLNKDPLFLMTANQLEVQREVERGMQLQVETLLNTALGPGRSVVRVAAEMDFSQSTVNSKTFEPASQVARAEERNESAGPVADTVGAASSEQSSITNYEINETARQVREQFGKIARLTVSVTVDTGGWLPQALTDLRNLVMAAVGYSEPRGDVVEVLQFPLDTTAREAERERQVAEERRELMATLLRYGLLAAAGIVLLIVLRSVFKSLDLLLPKPKPKPAIDIEAEAIEEEISAEAQRRAQMLDQVAKFARERPENVASLLATWLLEEKA